MPVTATNDYANTNRIRKSLSNGTGYYRSSYINDMNSHIEQGPTSYLVEQDPDTVIPAHFHQANQFQVVVSGSGKLGRRDIATFLIHYTDAYTPYGPIHSSADGLHYFTLRDGYDPGARFMPEKRAELVGRPGRHLLSERLDSAADTDWHGDTSQQCALPHQPDGVFGDHVRIKPKTGWTGPEPAKGGGQFWLVIDGDIRVDNERIAPHGCVYVEPDSPALRVEAGADGAQILVMQFPRKTP